MDEDDSAEGVPVWEQFEAIERGEYNDTRRRKAKTATDRSLWENEWLPTVECQPCHVPPGAGRGARGAGLRAGPPRAGPRAGPPWASGPAGKGGRRGGRRTTTPSTKKTIKKAAKTAQDGSQQKTQKTQTKHGTKQSKQDTELPERQYDG